MTEGITLGVYPKRRWRVRILSILLCQLIAGMPVNYSIAKSSDPIRLNRQHGKTVLSKLDGKSNMRVIHIQDAHCNEEAQLNIANMLDSLVKGYGVKLIGVEGASGKFNTGRISKFPNKNVLNDVVRYFLKKGKLSGSEYYSISRNMPDVLSGVEDKALYAKNYQELIDVRNVREPALRYFDYARKNLVLIQDKFLSDDIRKFNSEIDEIKGQKNSYTRLASFLMKYAQGVKLSTVPYPNFKRFVETIELEKKINFDKIISEKVLLIDKFTAILDKSGLSELLQKDLYFKVNKISPKDYYSFLSDIADVKKIDLSVYPNLLAYTKYLKSYDSIDQKKLFSETETLLSNTRLLLSVTEDDKAINRLVESCAVLEKYMSLTIPSDEFKLFLNNPDKNILSLNDFNSALQGYCERLGLDAAGSSADFKLMLGVSLNVEKFYNSAIKRDNAMVSNLLAEMELEGANTAVLIAGGFHSEGILKNLDEKGVNYELVVPEITKEQEDNPYFDLVGNYQNDFERLIASNTLQLALLTSEKNLLNDSDQVLFAKELDTYLAVMEADSQVGRGMSDTELIAHINNVMEQYGNPYKVSVLGRVSFAGVAPYRVYLVQIGDKKVTFEARDKELPVVTDTTALVRERIGDKVISIFDAGKFDDALADIAKSDSIAFEDYKVALSASYRKEIVNNIITNLLNTLFNNGEITMADINKENQSAGIDATTDIRAFLGYFLNKGLIKLSDGLEEGEKVYTWKTEYLNLNISVIDSVTRVSSGEANGALLTSKELRLSEDIINDKNRETTGKIKLYYIEKGLPLDIQYHFLAELNSGSTDLFNTANPGTYEFQSINGNIYIIHAVYRPSDGGYFVRVGLRDAPATPLPMQAPAGRAIIDSPVLNLKKNGIKVAADNPFDYDTVGVPKLFVAKSRDGKLFIVAKVFSVDKNSKTVTGIIDDFEIKARFDSDTLLETFKDVISSLLSRAEEKNIGLLHPVLDQYLSFNVPQIIVENSMLGVGADYDNVLAGTLNYSKGSQLGIQPGANDLIASDGAFADIVSILYTLADKAFIDRLVDKVDKVSLVYLFYELVLPMAQNAIDVLQVQYGLTEKPFSIEIRLAKGPIAEAHKVSVDGAIKLVINAHAFRSPGLLFAQIEHEIRHEILRGEIEPLLKKILPEGTFNSDILNFFTEFYISLKELDRYDRFGLEPELGIKTINAIKSPDNPIDPKGAFLAIAQAKGQERITKLINMVSQKYMLPLDSLPTLGYLELAVKSLDDLLINAKLDGNFNVYLDQKDKLQVISPEFRQQNIDLANKLANEKAVNIADPLNVIISPEAVIDNLSSIGAGAVILGDNVSIGRKVEIGKGVKIISDGGRISIADGVKIDDGVIIRVKAGQSIQIGAGTVLLNGTVLNGNVTIGYGAVIDNSRITNAKIDSSFRLQTEIRDSDIWGERGIEQDMVVINKGVKIYYSDIITVSEKQSVKLFENAKYNSNEVLYRLAEKQGYVVKPMGTLIDSGTVVEKAKIVNSIIGPNTTVREFANISHSKLLGDSVVRVNAKINLTYMGRSTEIGSKVDRSYFGAGAKSEHQGSSLQNVVMPNDYVIVDENGDYKTIKVPNTSNIGAGTVFENPTNIPVIGYTLFTGINSKVVTSENNPTVILPFTLTKDTTGEGMLPPFAYSQDIGEYDPMWMLSNYMGALINHYKKTKDLVVKLSYPMSDFDQLFVGSLRLALKLLDEEIPKTRDLLKTSKTLDSINKRLTQLEKARGLVKAHLASGAWELKNGEFVNGMFEWKPGDKWTTPAIEQALKVKTSDLDSISYIEQLLKENIQVPNKYIPYGFNGLAEMGTDGLRGIAQDSKLVDDAHITPIIAYRLGLVSALQAIYNNKDVVWLGGDTRESREYLMPAAVSGVNTLGLTVKHHDTFTDHTPVVQYKVQGDATAGAGLIVTASHNPYTDNGIKLLREDGSKITSQWEDIANRIVNSKNLTRTLAEVIFELGQNNFSKLLFATDLALQGGINSSDTASEVKYVNDTAQAMADLLPKRSRKVFYIDAANGAGARILKDISKKLSQLTGGRYSIELLNTEGKINERAGAEYIHKKLSKDIAAGKPLPQWLETRKGIEIGTLDGDADRNLLFMLNQDNSLDVVDGDKFAALKISVLQDMLKSLGLADKFQVGVAQTVLANMGSAGFLQKIGVPVMETKVGDKYVRDAAVKWALGDESKGVPAHGVAVYYEAAGHGSIIFSPEFLKAVEQIVPTDANRYAKETLDAIIKMQNMAGGDGIRNLLLFYALMEMKGLDFAKVNDSSYLYADVPKIELEFKVKYKNNVTSVENLGKELTGPVEVRDYVQQRLDKLRSDFQAKIDAGQVDASKLLVKDFRAIVRASGTSPKMRVQVDGPDMELVEEAAYDIAQFIYDNQNVIGDKSEARPADKLAAIKENRAKEQQAKAVEEFKKVQLPSILSTIQSKFNEDDKYKPLNITGRAEIGTDGIRGKASSEVVLDSKQITPVIAYRMGITTALHALSKGKTAIHVAGDTRESTQYLMDAFVAGASQIGVDIVADGAERIATTPQLQLFVRQDPMAGAGGVISASHNPAYDNGIKLINEDGSKFSEEWEIITNDIVNSTNLAESIANVISGFRTAGKPDEANIKLALDKIGVSGSVKNVPDAQVVPVSDGELSYVQRVVDAMVALLESRLMPQMETQTFVVDTANGAGSSSIEEIARRVNQLQEEGKINFRMEVVNTKGVINEDAGAEFIHKELDKEIAAGKPIPEWINPVRNKVVGTLDGDADRNLIFMIDDNNNLQLIDGDKFAALKVMVLNKYIKEVGLSDLFQVGVAQTVLANLGAQAFFQKINVPVVETKVGDKYVRQAAVEWAFGNIEKNAPAHGISVYYEAAGHGSILFSDDFKDKLEGTAPSRAKTILQNIIKLQNEAGGDGIMNLLLFRVLMETENLTFAQIEDDKFLYRDLPKTELQIKVENKNAVTSVGDLGKQLTGPAELVDYVKEIQTGLQAELENRIKSGEIVASDLPTRDFRVIVRASGTSPAMRVQVDGPVADMVEEAAYNIMEFIYANSAIKGVPSEKSPMAKYQEILKNRQVKLLAELKVTNEDGAKYIFGWEQLKEDQRINILLDLSRNGFTSEKLAQLAQIHEQGGQTAVEPPAHQAAYSAPDMKNISKANVKERNNVIALGSRKENVDRSALVIIAGGDGGRLLGSMGFTDEEKAQFSKPTIPVTAVAKKSPLQRILETVSMISKDKDSSIPVVLVVGPKTRGPIEALLSANKNFGIGNVIVVEQGKNPVMKVVNKGDFPKIILTPDYKIEYSPDGTGGIVDVLGVGANIGGESYPSIVNYLEKQNRDKVVFWQGDVGGLTPELYYGILGVSKGLTGKDDVDVVGMAYPSVNKKLGSMALVDGKIVQVIESVDRSRYPGLEEADDTSVGKMGLPRNSGAYMMSLKAIQQVIGGFPVHLQTDKEINGANPFNAKQIPTADKFEKFFPDIFPLVGKDSTNKVIIAVADESDMVPQKSIPQLIKASVELEFSDRAKLLALFAVSVDRTAKVELSPMFSGKIGTLSIGAQSDVYIGSNMVIGDNVVIGNSVSIKGENISIGNGARILDGTSIDVQGNGILIIGQGVVLDGNVKILVKDGETVKIGDNSKVLELSRISGNTEIGANSYLRMSVVSDAKIGDNVVIDDSYVTGLPAKPVVVSNYAKVTEKSMLTNVSKSKSWSFLEKADINPEFIPAADDIVLRKYRVKVESTVIGNGAVIRDARLKNTSVGSKTFIGPNVSIEHSEVGNQSTVTSGANITISHLGNSVVIGSEVSKSWLGDGVRSIDKSSYLSTIAPNEFIIADRDGNMSVLPLPNPAVIGQNIVFANYGGKPLPDLSGSLKGTSVVFGASINKANVINLYDHPDIAVTGLVNQPNVTVIYPFSKIPNGEVWGTVYPFTEASTLSPSHHKIGGVLESDPAMIVDMVNRIKALLPPNQKNIADKLVEGSLWLGVKLMKDQIGILEQKLLKAPTDQKIIDRLNQLKDGLRIYNENLDGRWSKPSEVNFSGIAMSGFDPAVDAVNFARVYGNPEIIGLEGKVSDSLLADEVSISQIQAILKDISASLTADEKVAYDKAFSPSGTSKDQVTLFISVAKDRLKQVRDVLASQYDGIDRLSFVISLGTERLAQRNVGGDNRIVINGHSLRSVFLMFSQAEHEFFHERVEDGINNLVDQSGIKQRSIPSVIFQQSLTQAGVPQSELPEKINAMSNEFFNKLKEFIKESIIISEELSRIHGLPAEAQAQVASILKNPANPIDLGGKFNALVDQTKDKSLDEKRALVTQFIFDNYEGMGIVKDTIVKIKEFQTAVKSQAEPSVPLSEFGLISQIDAGFSDLFEKFLSPVRKNNNFQIGLDESSALTSYGLSDTDSANIKNAATVSRYDIAAIDFDVFGDSKYTDSNSLYLANTLNTIKNNARKNGKESKTIIFSISKDANSVKEFLTFHRVNLDDVLILDRNDLISIADSLAVGDEGMKIVSNILNNARDKNDYKPLISIYDNAIKSDQDAVVFGNNLIKVLSNGFISLLNLKDIDVADIKFVAAKQGLAQMAVLNNLRTISWDALGSESVKEGDLIEAGLDNLLLLQALEPGSEVPRELIVSTVAKDKVINGVNVYDIYMAEKSRQQKESIDEPITIEFILSKTGADFLRKDDLKGIGVKAPRRKIDKEFMNTLQNQRVFDQSA